jgi:hypothetical protein
MERSGLWAVAIGCVLGACATANAPATGSEGNPPAMVSPDEQPSNVQHRDMPSAKRGVIVPSDVHLTGSESPVPAVTQTASPGALPVTGAEK